MTMNWKTSLDKYLTNPPDDGYEGWVEAANECFSNDFWNKNEDWICSDQSDHWFSKLCYDKQASPIEAAKIIERAFSLYKITQP